MNKVLTLLVECLFWQYVASTNTHIHTHTGAHVLLHAGSDSVLNNHRLAQQPSAVYCFSWKPLIMHINGCCAEMNQTLSKKILLQSERLQWDTNNIHNKLQLPFPCRVF